VQWDTSEHNWLEGRGEKLYLISMIDDATSQLTAHFVRHDSTGENLEQLRRYVEQHGRPVAVYTDKASLFQIAPRAIHHRDAPPQQLSQIGRALQELSIEWIAAHSPQAKGRIERSFKTAQDRLVKGLRRVGAKDLGTANAYLEQAFLPLWNERFRCPPQLAGDAHRAVPKGMNLDSVLSIRESRTVTADYTVRWQGVIYRVEREQVRVGMRGARVQLERWRGGAMAAGGCGGATEPWPSHPVKAHRARGPSARSSARFPRCDRRRREREPNSDVWTASDTGEKAFTNCAIDPSGRR
jgi:hypothetical protein